MCAGTILVGARPCVFTGALLILLDVHVEIEQTAKEVEIRHTLYQQGF